MTKGRLEAFSDGVIAIIITIMVLELKVPEGADLHALAADPAVLPVVCSELRLSRHLLEQPSPHAPRYHPRQRRVLWANLHLLFWLSLVPAATAWLGETESAPLPTALYGCVLLFSAIAYTILQNAIVRCQGAGSLLAAAVGHDLKGKMSLAAYMAAIPLAFVNPWISDALYVATALTWLVPDRRIESRFERERA